MANAPDELRKQKIAQALRPFLAEGEQLVVRQHDGEITAVSPATVKLRDQHARLYGQLLSANEQFQGGCGGTLFGFAGAGILCLGLTLGWWDDVLGGQAADRLRDEWWVYVFLFILGLGIPNYLAEWRAKMIYRRLRDDLLATLEAENIDRDLLVAMTQGDPDLGVITRHLKLDRDLARGPGSPP